jgi:hypothetical protein
MALRRPSVEGPAFVKRMREVSEKVRLLESRAWDFGHLPEVFAKDNQADVVAKELLHIFDGKRMTRIGRLVMGGVGTHFNLMGPIPSDSRIQMTDSSMLDAFNAQTGSRGLDDMAEYRKLGPAQTVDFYNYGMFYGLRHMVEWLLVHEAGCFPSTLENIVRHFAKGDVVQNYNYAPVRSPKLAAQPALMQAKCMSLSFPARAVEWMDKPLFGGFARDTIHVETLLTVVPSKVTHPYLELESEGEIFLGAQHYHFKRFTGVAQKDGVRGKGVPEERPKQSGRSKR